MGKEFDSTEVTDNQGSESKGGSKRNNNNNGNRKKKGKQTKPLEQAPKKSDPHGNYLGGNDFETWYNNLFVQDWGRIPYNLVSGEVLRARTDDGNSYPIDCGVICALPLVDTVGKLTGMDSPLNKLGWQLWTEITAQKSSLPTKFDMPDLMMYHLALGSLFGLVAHVDRCFAVAASHDARTRTWPWAILKAMNCDPLAWTGTQQIGDIRGRWNDVKQRIVQFPAAAASMYYMRSMWKYSFIYTEGPSVRDQLYLMKPRAVYGWVEGDPQYDDYRNSSWLETEWIGPDGYSYYTPDDWIDIVERLLSRMERSMSVTTIRSWLINSYGHFVLGALTPTVYGTKTGPIYNSEVLYMIKNAVCVNNAAHIVDNNVVQDPTKGFMVCNPTIGLNAGAEMYVRTMDMYTTDLLIDTGMDNPTITDTVENTRLKIYYSNKSENNTWNVNAFLEIPMAFEIYYYDENLDIQDPTYTTFSYCNAINSMNELSMLSSFKFHPCVTRLEKAGDEYYPSRFWDLDNYTTMSKFTFDKLNYACLMKLFETPTFGTEINMPNRRSSNPSQLNTGSYEAK